MKEQLIETWHINNRVHLMLLDAITETGLRATLSKRGGRTVALQFAHVHNLRLLKIERFNRALLDGQTKIDKADAHDGDLLKACLRESGEAMAVLLGDSVDAGGVVKGFKRGVVPLLGYLIAHESHHRGSILLTLKECGHPVPKDVRYGIWAWNTL